MHKVLHFRPDCVDGKRLETLYRRGELIALSFTRQRSQGDELVVTFCHKSKTLMELLKDGGAVHTVRYFSATQKLHQTGPLLDFTVADFMDIWDAGVNGVSILPEVSNVVAMR